MDIGQRTDDSLHLVPRSARPVEPMASPVASIRHWPAAGGGILISARISAFAGDSGALRNIDTFYLIIDHCGRLTAITPYVVLGRIALSRLLSCVDDELLELDGRLVVSWTSAGRLPRSSELERFRGKLDITTEIVTRACSATLVRLLISAAPFAASMSEAASLAALEPRPPRITLRSGLDLNLSQPSRRSDWREALPDVSAGGIHASPC
jgi:hypothetical protein